jgi:hypothetical protein
MQPIPPIRAAVRWRRAHCCAAISVVGFVGLLNCASTASAEDILFANTVSYSIVGRVGATGAETTPISQTDFLQNFNTVSIPAILNYDLTRDATGLGATGHVSAKISATAHHSLLAIDYSGDVAATTSAQLNTGLGIVDSSLVIARWQDTLNFTGNEPGRTTTIAATLKLNGGFGGSALSAGAQVDAAYTRTSLGLIATLNGTSVIPVSPYLGFGSLWGTSNLNAVTGSQPPPLSFEPPESVTVIMNFTQGQVYVLDYRMAVASDSWALINLAGTAAPQEANAHWSAYFAHTLTWGGITSVTDTLTGLPLDNYSLTSASGIDYVHAVPEPEQWLGIATALVALAALRAGTRLAKCRTPQ